MFYLEVSSKTGYNVEEAFYKMAVEVNEVAEKAQPSERGDVSPGRIRRGTLLDKGQTKSP